MIQITLSYEKVYFEIKSLGKFLQVSCARSHGVMVRTLNFESSDPSSNLGGTWWDTIVTQIVRVHFSATNTGLLFLLIQRAIFN